MIKSVTFLTPGYGVTYQVGNRVNGMTIAKIRIAALHFQGDPYDHYVGETQKGERIFAVNCLCPVSIEYLPNSMPIDSEAGRKLPSLTEQAFAAQNQDLSDTAYLPSDSETI